MEQYINKSAVVAKIENKLQDLIAIKENAPSAEKRVVLWTKIDMCNEILSFLDTLEAKDYITVKTIPSDGSLWVNGFKAI